MNCGCGGGWKGNWCEGTGCPTPGLGTAVGGNVVGGGGAKYGGGGGGGNGGSQLVSPVDLLA